MPWVNVSGDRGSFELQDRSQDEVMNDVHAKLSPRSQRRYVEIRQPISSRRRWRFPARRANIAIKLSVQDFLNLMFTVGNQIKAAIQTIPGLVDLKVEQQIERHD